MLMTSATIEAPVSPPSLAARFPNQSTQKFLFPLFTSQLNFLFLRISRTKTAGDGTGRKRKCDNSCYTSLYLRLDNSYYRSRSHTSYHSRSSTRAVAVAAVAAAVKANAVTAKESLASIEEEYRTKMEARKAELKKETVIAEAEILNADPDNINERLKNDHPISDSMLASHDTGPHIKEYWLIKHIIARLSVIADDDAVHPSPSVFCGLPNEIANRSANDKFSGTGGRETFRLRNWQAADDASVVFPRALLVSPPRSAPVR
ncbi:unnamed protein product [Acanthosepion pharaonis]|uniref:Uncharacterized protein n=1 Tax=Acanthosepion pharaonis TaxID=158019 RepID=A0A812CDG7_ACAPH|nr:unnamed protein product [Sepia pharaonis]